MAIDEFKAANRDNWDDRVAIHWGPDGYDAPGFIADPGRITDVVAFDSAHLDVAGKRLLHLQCHFGMDTLSWARLGADVTGVDFSEKAIEAARRISAESGTPGRFVLSELYGAPANLSGQFDVVYTGVGAINWLPDIQGWAQVVAHFLGPGGVFYMREGHPVLWGLDWRDDGSTDLQIRFPYFETPDPVPWDGATTYAGSGTLDHTRTNEWNHGIGEVFSALTSAGLEVTTLTEHRSLEWQGLPHMTLCEDGLWRLPPGQRDLVPLMFTVSARRRPN
ncbi:methyltransferase domain-containing protein [bacterium]|nr:methyltransferase domain-containing protein [bacterium]